MAKHTGTEYNVIQRIQAAVRALEVEKAHYEMALDMWYGSDHPLDKRRLTLAKTKYRKAKQRLSLACTYWLQHNPLKD